MEPTPHPRGRSISTALPSYAESNACTQTFTLEGLPAPNARPQPIKWRFAIQTFNDQYLFDHLELSDLRTPLQVIERIVLAYHLRISLLARLIYQFILCRRPVIYFATLASTTFIDLEAMTLPNYVFLENFVRNDILTAAFYNPSLLQSLPDTTSFFEEYMTFVPGYHESGKIPQACVVGFEFDYLTFFFLSTLSFLLCIGLGVLVGFASSNVEAGCAFGGGLASLVAALQVLVLKVSQ